MKAVYIYVLDTMADWEVGYVMAELNSRRFFKADAPEIAVKTVGVTREPIKTMGGLTVVPDCSIDEIVVDAANVLVLPGADAWANPKHLAIVGKAKEFLDVGGAVCAICGGTVALANAGLLDYRKHASNGVGFLDMFCPNYKGKDFYVDAPAVADGNLFTSGATSGLYWTKLILDYLKVFSAETLEAWYNYFSTGKAEYFYVMMNAVQKSRNQ